MSASVENRIVRLATASNPQEAARWQQALEAEGIRCRVVGEMLGSFGVVYPGSVQPEIWVFESDVDRAIAVLESSRKGGERACP
jgi:Putative prokaryotic signal transducing protein